VLGDGAARRLLGELWRLEQRDDLDLPYGGAHGSTGG